MNAANEIIQFLSGISQMAVGFVLGTVITGVFTWKVVVPKVMKNKEVQDLKTSIQGIENFFKSDEYKELMGLGIEAKTLFKEAVPVLHRILEELKANHPNHQE